jgi:hypothetical protein
VDDDVNPSLPQRRRPTAVAAIVGLAIVLAYAGLAWMGGRSTVLARRPLLDGLGPAQPYRWVDPPPELAATNQEPSAGRYTLEVNPDGVLGQVLITSDNQVTLVVGGGSVGVDPPTTSLAVALDPLSPGELADPGGDRIAFGNAYRIEVSPKPSGDPVRRFAEPWDTILVYPVTATLQAAQHELLWSPDGRRWRTLRSVDSHAQQQVEAAALGPGYVLVAGVPIPAPVTSSPDPSGGPSRTLLLVGLAVAIAALAVGVALIARGRGSG